MNNFPCICGHEEEMHKWWDNIKGTRCEICIIPFINSFVHYKEVLKTWHNFMPDNLKYLEQQYEKSNKIN